MKRWRVYADTSVFGGCFDPEFEQESCAFFGEVAENRFLLVISDVTVRELALAPHEVRRVLEKVPPDNVEFIPSSDEIRQLQDAYLKAGVLRPGSDLDKISKYEAVNLMHGYKPLRIHSPKEVIQS